jgi:hypothetical protein
MPHSSVLAPSYDHVHLLLTSSHERLRSLQLSFKALEASGREVRVHEPLQVGVWPLKELPEQHCSSFIILIQGVIVVTLEPRDASNLLRGEGWSLVVPNMGQNLVKSLQATHCLAPRAPNEQRESADIHRAPLTPDNAGALASKRRSLRLQRTLQRENRDRINTCKQQMAAPQPGAQGHEARRT